MISLLSSVLSVAGTNDILQVWQVANNGTRLVFIEAGEDEDYMDMANEDDNE